MKEAKDGTNWFFVDESGDPIFYNEHGNLIVGTQGCSPILILGFIETAEPKPIRRAIADLHTQIAEDEYLKKIPSIVKTNVAFHAKDDVPEVRQAVYKLIRTLDFKAQFIVARKLERVFQNTFNDKPEHFYNYLVGRLFQNVTHRYQENRICFAKRGSATRQQILVSAIRTGLARFEEKYQRKVTTRFDVLAQMPSDEPCLQIIDYMNWAIQRAFVRGEMRYYDFVADKVSLVYDLYDTAKYPKNWYDRRNPFDIKKASPL